MTRKKSVHWREPARLRGPSTRGPLPLAGGGEGRVDGSHGMVARSALEAEHGLGRRTAPPGSSPVHGSGVRTIDPGPAPANTHRRPRGWGMPGRTQPTTNRRNRRHAGHSRTGRSGSATDDRSPETRPSRAASWFRHRCLRVATGAESHDARRRGRRLVVSSARFLAVPTLHT